MNGIELAQIFFPYATEKHLEAWRTDNFRFAHYTSAESAFKILSNENVWLRNSSVMNDYMEIEHGLQLLGTTYAGPLGDQFKQLIGELYPMIPEQLADFHNGWQNSYRAETYMLSIGEHLSSEDENGRLSMWREYGRGTGVALVFKSEPFLTPSDAVGAYTSPVLYADQNEFDRQFKRLLDSLQSNRTILADLGEQAVFGRLFEAFRNAALTTKHSGFAEEREWRIVYAPEYEASPHIEPEHVVLGGYPQKIFKLPLKRFDGEPPIDATITSLFDRIIIGPTDQPMVIAQSFIDLLKQKGVADAEQRIQLSDISVRF